MNTDLRTANIISDVIADGFEKEGYVYCYLNPVHYEGSTEKRDRLVKKLNELSIFDYNNLDDISSRRNSERPLNELSEHELFAFLDILEDYCIDVRCAFK